MSLRLQTISRAIAIRRLSPGCPTHAKQSQLSWHDLHTCIVMPAKGRTMGKEKRRRRRIEKLRYARDKMSLDVQTLIMNS